MNTAVLFSKKSDEWATPQDLYAGLHYEFRFEVDAAATRQNSKCPLYYGLDDLGGERPQNLGDALDHDWLAVPHWCNPPYSKCREFVAKAAEQRLKGTLTVMLLPARTDTRWFHDHLWQSGQCGYHGPRPGIEVRFLRGRLKFGDSANSAPFPSVIVVFRP